MQCKQWKFSLFGVSLVFLSPLDLFGTYTHTHIYMLGVFDEEKFRSYGSIQGKLLLGRSMETFPHIVTLFMYTQLVGTPCLLL
jgi:hypothetical protein